VTTSYLVTDVRRPGVSWAAALFPASVGVKGVARRFLLLTAGRPGDQTAGRPGDHSWPQTMKRVPAGAMARRSRQVKAVEPQIGAMEGLLRGRSDEEATLLLVAALFADGQSQRHRLLIGHKNRSSAQTQRNRTQTTVILRTLERRGDPRFPLNMRLCPSQDRIHYPFAMQKVVGSNPIIRSRKPRKSGVFFERADLSQCVPDCVPRIGVASRRRGALNVHR
jgi:hypothetical protein